MSVRILHGDRAAEHELAVLYCSTDMVAFGPVFDSAEHAEDFLLWLSYDARTYAPPVLLARYDEWRGLACNAGGDFVGRTEESAPYMPDGRSL